jgi:hypothetical protein
MNKIKNKLEVINWTDGSKLSDSQYPKRVGNNYNLVRNSFTAKQRNDFCQFVSIRHNFFSSRVTENWNKLHDNVVNAPSLKDFKARLDEFMGEMAAIARRGSDRFAALVLIKKAL